MKERHRLFTPVPTRFLWIYNQYFKKIHEELKNELDEEIEFLDKFEYSVLMEKIESEHHQKYCLILDDSLQSPVELDLIYTRLEFSKIREVSIKP